MNDLESALVNMWYRVSRGLRLPRHRAGRDRITSGAHGAWATVSSRSRRP